MAIIDQIVALLGELRAELAAAQSADEANSDHGPNFADETLIETTAASARFNYPSDTIRLWCRQGAGIKRGGRWLVDVTQIQKRVAGL